MAGIMLPDKTKRMSIDALLIVLESQNTRITDLQEQLEKKEQYFQTQLERKENDAQGLLERREKAMQTEQERRDKSWKQELAIKEKERKNAREGLDKVMEKRDKAVNDYHKQAVKTERYCICSCVLLFVVILFSFAILILWSVSEGKSDRLLASLRNSDHSKLKDKVVEKSLTMTEQVYKKLLTDRFESLDHCEASRRRDLEKIYQNLTATTAAKTQCSAELLICNDKLAEYNMKENVQKVEL